MDIELNKQEYKILKQLSLKDYKKINLSEDIRVRLEDDFKFIKSKFFGEYIENEWGAVDGRIGEERYTLTQAGKAYCDKRKMENLKWLITVIISLPIISKIPDIFKNIYEIVRKYLNVG